MRNIDEIKLELMQAEEWAKPVIEARNKAVERVNNLRAELEQCRLENGLYRPMSDLEQYKGKYIRSIDLVKKNEDGSLEVKTMYDDELFKVDDNGHLDYSSYACGIMQYYEPKQIYVFSFHGHETEYDFVGFLEIKTSDRWLDDDE